MIFSRPLYPTLLLVTLCVLSLSLLACPTIMTLAKQGGLEAAWERAREAGAYAFTADIEQTLIPRPLPGMIGQTDERVDMRIEGDVTLPDQVRMELHFEGGRFDVPPLGLVREGAETYLLKGDERIPVENPAGLTSPTSDYLSYLAAAENVQELPSPDVGGGAGGGGLAHYSYDINGPRFAEHVREQMEAQFRESEQPLPPGVQLSSSSLLQRMSGHGELWVDADGLPRRQVVDLEMPEASEEYDARAHIIVDFRFDESANIQSPISNLKPPISKLDLFFLTASVAMAGVVVAFRRRRWVYGLVAVGVSVIMVTSPLLQAAGIVRFQKRQAQAAPADTIAEALGLEPSAIGPQDAIRNTQYATHPAAPSDYEPNIMCGDGDPGEDSDGDGMSDADENCLGTDPEHEDSDRDMITDTLELDGFDCGGKHWTGDPFTPDANRDGLHDLAEWPEPVGAAPDLEDVADDWDPDGDGVPNLWDVDNDGDEVPDSIDLSPFARTTYSDSFSLTTQGSDFDGYQYIELQVQPEDTSHLRYSTTYLDWPYDELGQIVDLDDSTEDITLYPVLKIRTNQPPDEELARKYGVIVFEDDGDYILHLSPVPVNDGGRIVAFYVKVAYGPDDLDDIRWESVELLWMVRMNMDQEVRDRYGNTSLKTTDTPLHTYLEESFRVTGLQITKSRNFESMILGTPDSPNDDRWIFNLLFGLGNTFLNHQDPDLQEIEFRFSSPNTPLEKTWGVTSTLVTVDLPSTPYGHGDEGLEKLPARLQDFLEHNYPADSNPSLVLATQEEVGLYSLEDEGQFEPGSSINVNLADVAMSTQRGLKNNTYEYDEDDGWDSLDLQETLDLMQERYEGELADIVEQLEDEYPELTTEDLKLLLDMFYTTWFVGRVYNLNIDGQALAPEGREDQEVFDELHQQQDTLPAYLLEAADLGEPGGGLRIGDNPSQYWEYQNLQGDKGIDLNAIPPTWIRVGKGLGFAVRAAAGVWAIGQMAKFTGEIGVAFQKELLWQHVKHGFNKMAGLGLVASLLAIGIIMLVAFAAADWDRDSPAFKQAWVYALMSVAMTLVLFAIALIPLVGVVLVGLWAIMDVLALIFSLGEFSFTLAIVEWLTSLIYEANVLTTLEDVGFTGFDAEVMDEEMGLIVGNRIRVRDGFVGTIERTSDGGNDDLNDSWVEADFHGSSTVASWANQNGSRDCDRSGSTLTCENDVGVEFKLNIARRNARLTVKTTVDAKTFWEECWVGDCERKTEKTNLPDDLPSYQEWEPIDIYLDVLPDNIGDLFDWKDIDNPDRDGDGLLNDEEKDSLGTDPDDWDTDGDGLADELEVDYQEDLGTDPLDADTDDDGLLDGLEYHIGTEINAADTDDDGLTDGEEVFHQEGSDWVGGWLVELPGGGTARVFSDPLVADADGDDLNDRSERNSSVSPFAYNDTAQLDLDAEPLAESSNGAVGVYVTPDQKVTMDLVLENTGPRAVTSTLTLCLPDFLTDVEYEATLSGDRTPGTITPAASCDGLEWSFEPENDQLQPNEAVNTTVTATVAALGSSASGEVSVTVAYLVGEEEVDIIDQATVIVDVDDPVISITAPLSGTLLGGGISHYVVGGASSDESSWVEIVEVDLPAGAGTVDTEGISPWAYTWELPDDGVYTLTARSYDYVGYTSLTATAVVTVDNTAPTVTLALEDGEVVTGEVGSVITLTLEGSAGDNLSGLTRVQVSTDGRPWREVWASGGQTILSADWSTEWVLPSEASAQGKHTVEVRALDRAGNESEVLRRTIIVDVVPPTSELTDRTYLADPPPHVQTDERLDFYGVANDAGNVPAPSRPVDLVGDLDSIDDATIWLEMSSIDDDDSGVGVAWLGDFNGDRLADLVVGLPSAEGGAGRVTIVYGRAGGWPTPTDAELLADSLSSLVGKAGAKIGDAIGPAGDVDGDGFSDLLVGDSKNSRVYVVFGHPGPLGRDLVLEGPRYPYWSELTVGSGKKIGDWLSAAGDVNGDGFDDLLVGATGAVGETYLLFGHSAPWWETVPLHTLSDEAIGSVTEIDTDPDGAYLSGVGDMDGDEYDEFVVAEGKMVYLFEGQAVFEDSLELSDAIATFLSSEARPQVVALGDVNGDDGYRLADFIYADGDAPKVIFGDADRNWTTQTLDFTPAPSGFLVAPGDVDYDGLGDILVQNEDGDANLILGKDLSVVKATLTGVQAAASAPYAAGADLNSDGSSDLLLVPSALGGARMSVVDYGPLPHVDPDDLPVAETGFFRKQSDENPISSAPLAIQANLTVDDDGDADFASIQAAVDAAGDGDYIYADPGVYDSFTVTVDNLHIWGDHADAVFVDGGGGDFAIKIQGADGVELKRLTLRNADNAVVLENAGVEGYKYEEKKIVLERVLMYDFDSHAVKMDRVSSARLTRCTSAGKKDHIELDGAPDPAMDESWDDDVSTDSRTAASADGGMFGDGEKLYFVDDSAQIDVYTPAPVSWNSLPDAPMGKHAGATVDENGSLWALRRDLTSGFDGPVYAVAYVSETEIYVGGDFNHNGNVELNYLARWNGSEWEEVGSGGSAPDDTVYDIKISGVELYVGGAFGLRHLPNKDSSLSIWDNWGDISGDGAVYALALDGTTVYVGGSFDDIGGLSAHKIARRTTTGWGYLGAKKSYCNGIKSGYVSALAVLDDYVYLGGNFNRRTTSAGSWGRCYYSDDNLNLARVWRGSGAFASKPNDYDLNSSSEIYALEVVGDNIIVGGDFWNVICFYDDGRPWCSASGDADNLAILKSDGDWWLPGYLKANDPVRTIEKDGDDLYIGGDFTRVGGSTTAGHVAHYDYAYGGWDDLDYGVNDTVYAVAAGDGDRAYVGGEFFQAGDQAAFNFVRWNGSQWTWRSEQAFYEYDGSWHARPDLPTFVGEGSDIVSDGDGSLYAVPASGSRALYRYTVDDGWEALAESPDGVGTGGALVWANGCLYTLRGGETDDFYRYNPDADEWSTLASLPLPRVAGTGASLAWDGRNWLYAWIGGNGRQFLRYCIDEDRWEVLDDAPAEVNAGGGLARIGQNLYGVPGGGEVLWSYDPIAVYPEKLALDHVAFVVPETVAAADWINLGTVVVPPDDFVVGGTGNTWVGRSGFAWSPEPLLDDSAQITHDNARFLDVERDVYRVGSGTLLGGGYHTYRSDYTVSPCEGDPEDCPSPNPIQTGINSGANRVLLNPGVYDKGFYLISGVEVVGDGADLTIVEPSEHDATIVRAEGVVGARLSMLTLNGADSGVDGLFLEDGARSVTVDHTIIRGTNVGISTTGETTELEVVNNTIVSNTNGMIAANCAPVDVRNTIFANHSGTGLTYDDCATRKLHKYNLYWENAIDDLNPSNPGPGELFLDPLFVDPGPPSHDYHTQDESPVIDAGDPGDPPPPGAGDRVDIGYIDQNRAGLYVNGDYCETCVNDGLSWQVDAFDKIQDALDKADENLRELEGWRYTVAVAAGTYTETLTVPSYVRLVGDGAEETSINANGMGVAVTVDGVVQVGINGFTIRGCTDTAAISVTGASNAVTITRNIIENCDIGVAFGDRASGLVSFNTVAGRNSFDGNKGILSSGAGSWAVVENNIFYDLGGCSEGDLWVKGDGQIFNDYNWRDYWALHSDLCSNVDAGANEVTGYPLFASGGYRLNLSSPARDAASPFVEPPPGGGERADMGYYELVADPITLFLGREDVSSATGNSGVSEVKIGFSEVSDPDAPVTDTLPSTWTTVTLDTPEETVSYWQVAFTPTTESLYRFYSRATDVATNQEEGEEIWYDGAFVADSVPPIVTWTKPSAVVSTPLELRAEVYDYAAGEFSVEDVYFVVDGVKCEAEWAADPWDEENEEPRPFRAWVDLSQGWHIDAAAVAEDRAGNVMSDTISFDVSGSTDSDTISPTLDVLAPLDGAWFTQTVVFSGTAADNGGGSGVAAVEISLDGGYTWLPATVDGADWELTWESSEDQEFVSYPARVRARDQAGNSTVVSLAFSIDNVPPIGPHVEEFVATLGVFEQDAPPGTHFDMPVGLRITWRKPMDGSGVVTTTIAVDQVTNTLPTISMGTVATNTTEALSAPGDWYVHLAVRDKLNNQFTRHYGPWHVGTIASGMVGLINAAQTIFVDGEIDIDMAEDIYNRTGWEWIGYEYIDDFERIYAEGLTPEEALDWWGRQRLFTTWDGDNLFLGWMGAWWELDGELWVYLDTVYPGGTTQPVNPPVAHPVAPADITLPFDADYAINVTSSTSGTLWVWTGAAWQVDTVTDWEFAHGDSGDTEIRLALDWTTISSFQMIVFALDDDGQPWSVFPSTNPLSGTWLDGYLWYPGLTITPTIGQPIGTSMIMDTDSPQAPQAAWCPDSYLDYVVELNNLELRELADLQLAFDVSPGLNYHSVDGAAPAGVEWLFDVPPLSMETTHFVTVTGQLVGDLSGVTAVTANVTLQLVSGTLTIPLLQDRVIHRVDGQPPSIPFTADPSKAIRPVYGSATDGDGSGLALVEYRIDGGAWHPVSGTLFWSADIELPQATTWEVSVRAQDRCGEYSEIETVAFSDSIPPTTTLETHSLETSAPDLEGTASDLPSGGEVISVEVRIDDEAAAWQPASVGAPDAGGVQDWQFTWNSSWDGVTHTVWIRAADVAGNVSQTGPFKVYVAQGEMVGGYTESVMAHRPLWLRVTLLVAVVALEIAVSVVFKKRHR